MSMHQRTYIGPYIHFCTEGFEAQGDWPSLDNERLMRAICGVKGDTWIPNVGKYNLYERDYAIPLRSLTPDMLDTQSFSTDFASEIATLQAQYGDKGVVAFGIVNYLI